MQALDPTAVASALQPPPFHNNLGPPLPGASTGCRGAQSRQGRRVLPPHTTSAWNWPSYLECLSTCHFLPRIEAMAARGGMKKPRRVCSDLVTSRVKAGLRKTNCCRP